MLGILLVLIIASPLLRDFRMTIRADLKASLNADELLVDFLDDANQLAMYKEFLEGEFSAELLLFFVQIREYKKLFVAGIPGPRAEHQREKIIKTFLAPGAKLEINLPESMSKRYRLQSQGTTAARSGLVVVPLEADTSFAGPLRIDEFDAAREEVLYMMSSDPLLRFQQDPRYQSTWQAFLQNRVELNRRNDDLAALAAAT
mmetsp:Transcript_25953/g.82369  ORF Transcript_25953/g.82369 Transcript_25953/m.82369 type:complete len:202 (-) Transcript_25953:597-1202(-)